MDQLKVLIVDDEYLIRNLLRMQINWEEQGMTIVGEAANAHEALDMVDELMPDIIFTDICMPFIDGIEFSGIVFEKYPDIKIVVVTAHDEFEFARKSLKLGIADFILKPIRAQELLSVTERLKKKINEERSRDKELEKLKKDMERNFPFLKEKFLNQWITGSVSPEEISEKAEYFKISAYFEAGMYQIAVIEVSPPADGQTEEQSILLEMACRSKAEAFFQNDPQVVIFSDTKNQIVIMYKGIYVDFVNYCEILKINLINTYKCFVCIGIGQQHENVQEVHLGYQEACRALDYKVCVGKNQVVCYEDVIAVRGQQYRSAPDLLRQLQFNISIGSSERSCQVLNKIFDNFSFTDASQFRLAAMDVISECQQAAVEQQLEFEHILNTETLVAILTADNLPELKKVLESYILQLSKAIFSKTQTKEGNLIGQVKEYLENNMSDPSLSLAGIAAAFFISPGHLGRLMKKETGQTFVEYLTNIRMSRAEILLKNSDLKGYQVGEKVGITDPHYFSILFKKNVGRSLNDYRNELNELRRDV
ncbi:MAG TPA: response regulator [Ruminiclostridium sp.]|nr:response regulator [Ruminiclostridium sp.]